MKPLVTAGHVCDVVTVLVTKIGHEVPVVDTGARKFARSRTEGRPRR